ncbi:MAG: NAD(P)-dependent oxidoreductase [Anaerolineales bacterium]|nr:NAD(P)-dependent oxidoreductase [Anaerolineales bacterium]
MTETIGILHPGEMGVSVAASARNSGHSVMWVSEGRSQQTKERAKSYDLVDAHSLEQLCRTSTIILSVCPPHAAEQVAREVMAHSFKGLYADLNAISPQRTIRIGKMMEEGGSTFVDGGIIGGPAWEAGTTWLYLSGREARRVAQCFSAGALQTEVIGEEAGRASALKMCYAAYTKGSTALLCAVLGAAEGLEVRSELERQWSRDEPGSAERAAQRTRRVTAKAWRFAGEMEEIAATFAEAGIPSGFHEAAAEVYGRLADFKGRETKPELEEVLRALLGDARGTPDHL